MPQHKPLEALKQLCLDSVIKHMNDVWCADFVKTMFNQSHWVHVVGPFDSLPASLCHEIFVNMKMRSLLRKQHIYLLIHPYYKELNCSGEKSELALILKLADARCGIALERLDLSRCPSVPKKDFLNSFPAFTNLRVLNLRHSTNVDDSLIAVVGVYGANLIELDLSYTKVGDRGVSLLLLPQDENSRPDDRYGKCQKLRSLNLLHSYVSDEGAKLALRTLTDLSDFGYPDSVSVVYELLHETPDRIFALTSLHSSNADLKDEALAAAAAACPRASQFYLFTYDGMSVASLIPLAETAATLSEVHICNEEQRNALEIADALYPVLAQKGFSLISLNFTEVSKVNVRFLLEFCPNLRHLRLLFNTNYTSDLPHGVKLGKSSTGCSLQTLEVSNSEKSDDNGCNSPSSDDLLTLLGSPELSKVELSFCENLTDHLVEELVTANLFTRISSLILQKCHHVTLESLLPVLLGKNPLSTLKLLECREITLRDFQDYQRQLKLLGLNKVVTSTWS